MNAMTSTTRAQFDWEETGLESGPTFEKRLTDVASDYETLDAENVAGVGI